MQFPVPQFTDVEDRIIGPLTLKQFGIIFGAGVLVMLPYSLTKSIPVLIIFGLVFGLPALGLAFAKLNGRPLYNMIGYFVDFLMSPKVLVFFKEGGGSAAAAAKAPEAPVEISQTVAVRDPNARLREINKILQEQAEKERNLVK